jgi:hypothetical protein
MGAYLVASPTEVQCSMRLGFPSSEIQVRAVRYEFTDVWMNLLLRFYGNN